MKNIKRCLRILPVFLGLLLLLFGLTATPVSAAGSLTLSPTQGSPESTVTLGGSFTGAPTTTATVSFDSANVGSAQVVAGSISGTFLVPVKARGTYSVVVSITGDSATAQFTIVPKLTLSATSGYVGSQVTVNGKGFSPGPVYIYMDSSTNVLATTSANTSGVLTAATITIPAATKATHVIRAVDSAGSIHAATTNFDVNPRLVISPESGGAGDQISVTGTGFAGSSLITLTIDGEDMLTSPATVNSNTTGGFTAIFTIPDDIARGAHSIIATDLMDNSAGAILMVEEKIELSATSGYVGDKIDIEGRGFSSNRTVTLYLDSRVIPTTNLRTDSSGSFAAEDIAIPAATKGSHTVKARDADGNEAEATFTISPRITADVSSGPVGTTITLSGSGFAGSSSITILYDTEEDGRTSTDAYGSFTGFTFNVPASVKGNHNITARDGGNNTDSRTFNVIPLITISQNIGPVGTEVTIGGSGFAASSNITLFYDNDEVDTARTDANGSFAGIKIDIPASPKGSHTIMAKDASSNQDSKNFAVTPAITLTPASGFVGSPVVISGTGFAASTSSSFIGVSLTMGATGIQPTGTSIINTDENGSFSATFAMPPATHGEHIIQARDSAENTAQAVIAVSQKLVLGASGGFAGDQVSLTGTGFAGSKTVTIDFGGQALSTQPAAVVTDSTGSFSASVSIPFKPAGTYAINVTDGTNQASASFTAAAFAAIDKVTTQNDPGFVGMDLSVTGSGFKASSGITIALGASTLATGQTDGNGSFGISFRMPAATAGEHKITASDGTTTKEFTFFMDAQAPPSPSLLEPANASKPKQPLTFSWNAVTDISGVTYDLQVSRDAGFTTLVMEKTGLTDTEYAMTEDERLDSASASAPYQWRVRAVDSAGNKGVWTTPATFTIGFIWPMWLTFVLFGVALLVVLYIGMRIGSRIALKATEYEGYVDHTEEK